MVTTSRFAAEFFFVFCFVRSFIILRHVLRSVVFLNKNFAVAADEFCVRWC